MGEKHFQVTLPEELLGEFGWQESDVPRGVRETLVMELLRLDRFSEAEAAKALGVDRWELIEIMGRHQVPAVRMDLDELERELQTELRGTKGA